jgi:hypothetical protein
MRNPDHLPADERNLRDGHNAGLAERLLGVVTPEAASPVLGPRQRNDAKREATHIALWVQQVLTDVTENTDLADVEGLLLAVEATSARLRAMVAKARA